MTGAESSKPVEPLILLAAADDSYAMPLAVMLFSALEGLTPGRSVKIYILDGGISSANRTRLERVVRLPKLTLHLEWLTPDSRALKDLPLGSGAVSYLSQAMYLRLFAADFIAEPKVIYLDSDMLIQHDLEDLWKLDLSPFAAAAVPEKTSATLGQALAHLDSKAYPLEAAAPYYNSGVLLINLDRWRSEDVAAAALAVIRAYREAIHYPDQDALNIVLQEKWLTLDRRWNFQANSITLRSEPLPPEDVFILHYSTRFKPWLKLAFGLERAYFGRYLRVLRRSGWFSAGEFAAFYARLVRNFAAEFSSSRLARLKSQRSRSP